MGLLTLTQIKNEISSHHANRTDIVSRLNTVVDLAQMRIARIHDWDQLKFLVTDTLSNSGTLSDDKVYDLDNAIPAGHRIKNMYSIRVISDDGRSKKLVGKTHSEFDEFVPEPEWFSRRMPEIYIRTSSLQNNVQIKRALELWPIPDQTYTINIRFQVWPRFLSDDPGAVEGDTSDLDIDDGIIHLATSYLYNSFGREDKARHHFGIYSAVVKDALRLDETDYDTVIAGVKVPIDGFRMGEYWNDPFFRGV